MHLLVCALLSGAKITRYKGRYYMTPFFFLKNIVFQRLLRLSDASNEINDRAINGQYCDDASLLFLRFFFVFYKNLCL